MKLHLKHSGKRIEAKVNLTGDIIICNYKMESPSSSELKAFGQFIEKTKEYKIYGEYNNHQEDYNKLIYASHYIKEATINYENNEILFTIKLLSNKRSCYLKKEMYLYLDIIQLLNENNEVLMISRIDLLPEVSIINNELDENYLKSLVERIRNDKIEKLLLSL